MDANARNQAWYAFRRKSGYGHRALELRRIGVRKRCQQGSLRKSDGYWVAQWREDDWQGKRHHRSRSLGKISQMTKSKARQLMAEIIRPLNESAARIPPGAVTLKDFV